MRKRFVLLLFVQSLLLVVLFSNAKAQVYQGSLFLNTQAQVDAFNFTEVHGSLTISGQDITNLNGLSELIEVYEFLIIADNDALINLDGLSNLKDFFSLIIKDNRILNNIDGLIGIHEAWDLEISKNAGLIDVNGLSNLKGVSGDFTLDNNPALTNVDGLLNLQGVSGSLSIDNNRQLTNLNGLSKLKSAIKDLTLNNNDMLTNINGLSNLEELGSLSIINSALTNIDALSNVRGYVGHLIFASNPYLTDLDGLSGVENSVGTLSITNNMSLNNIDGLSGIPIFQAVRLEKNASLTNVNGLSSLLHVLGNLTISSNNSLANLDGLSGLKSVWENLIITNNPSLIDFCGLYNLFNSGEIKGSVISIINNGAHTIDITPPAAIIVTTDAGVCYATIADAVIGSATPLGCLPEFIITQSEFPVGNSFPVGSTQIIWEVKDGAGNIASTVQTITVLDVQVPLVNCPVNITVACASDVPAVNIHSVTATDNCSAIVEHVSDIITNQTCVNRFTLTRTYKATDPSRNSAACSQVITVNDDIPPQLTGLSVSKEVLWPPNHKMQDITVNYTATDNCVSSPIVTITVTSNEPVNGTADGDTDPDWEIIDDHHVKLRAERAANGNGRIYTITVTVDDGCNPPVSANKQVIIAHNITGPQSGKPFKVGSTVAFSGEFWDKPGNTHTAKWLLDGLTVANGTVTEPAGNQKGKVNGSYKFRSAGVYKLQMNITDQNGVTSYANTNEDLDAIVVIYDPNGGYTYGGGYYNSPAGALKSNPTATGKASYGFAMNYFRNSTNPKGETQFEFKVGEFEFNALNFDYLVINNSMAQFKGTGKIIGGQSGIGFTMTVIDGQLDGSGVDKVRMKIYNKNTGAIIYDNQPGASDASLPTAAVGANSVIVIQGNSVNAATTKTSSQEVDAESKAIDQLEVNVYPNPANKYFNISINSNDKKEKIMLQVFDQYGRSIEIRNNISNSSVIRLGDLYRPGVYYIRILQGRKHKEVKLVKLSD